jgi:hypothetical protein
VQDNIEIVLHRRKLILHGLEMDATIEQCDSALNGWCQVEHELEEAITDIENGAGSASADVR